MESIIVVDGQDIELKANAITAIHYKSQFRSDVLKDTLHALGGIEAVVKMQELEKAEDYKQLANIINNIDTVLIQQLVWAFAKTANRNLPPFFDWLEEVDLPPVTELLLVDGFVDLLIGNVYRKK